MSPSATATSSALPSLRNQPRHTPSLECHPPPKPSPLSEPQLATLDTLRTQIQSNETFSAKQKAWASDDTLVRYLKARKWNLQEAKQAVVESIQWHESYNPAKLDREGLWTETSAGKLYVSGFDMESRPLLYMKPRLENTAASPAQIRHVCFHLETAIALMPEGVQNLAILIDFSGSSMRTNPGVAVAREIINVLGSHYPERLGKAYIIHAPWFFFPFYKLISPFIDPVTKSKINFVDMKKQKPRSLVSTPSSSAPASEVDAASVRSSKKSSSPAGANGASGSALDNINLLDMIPEDMLEQEYGGSSDYVYDQEAYWTAVEKVLAEAEKKEQA
ncbi:hypothetical protein CPC16_010798 [Podila verticillata]|nr:hypothetical protein BGZ52_003261 [Haplosporangium bisporale]KAF9209837.1 hypothetical protein BGZ59_009937 [Podila verticillata]KAF9379361.1 hypothetical protein CPC16_010798 [Podila verticillata]